MATHTGGAESVMESRDIQCGAKTYTVRVYDDGVIGIYDSDGRMILGWPETTVFAGAGGLALSDEEWCERLSRLRKLA